MFKSLCYLLIFSSSVSVMATPLDNATSKLKNEAINLFQNGNCNDKKNVTLNICNQGLDKIISAQEKFSNALSRTKIEWNISVYLQMIETYKLVIEHYSIYNNIQEIYVKIKEKLELLMKQDKNNFDIIFELANTYDHLNETQNAINSFLEAINIARNSDQIAEANYQVALIMDANNRNNEARHYFLEAKKNFNAFTKIKEACIKIAQSYLKDGEYTKAVASFEDCIILIKNLCTSEDSIKLNAENNIIYNGYILALKNTGNFDKALNVALDRYSQKNFNIETLRLLADIYFKMQNYDEAVKKCDEVLKKDKDNVEIVRLKLKSLKEIEKKEASNCGCSTVGNENKSTTVKLIDALF